MGRDIAPQDEGYSMKLRTFILLVASLWCFVGCSIIDDDLSVCGPDNTDYYLHYTMQLVTHMQTKVDDQLAPVGETALADTLKSWLAPVFSGVAHDLHMNFYATDEAGELKQNRSEIIDASQKSYTLTIPREDYMHLAIVNIQDNASIAMMGAQYAPSLRLTQVNGDTLRSHPTAVYTARLPMRMSDNIDQSFHVDLYMVSCAVALVIDTPSFAMPPMKVLLSGTATGFNVRDSVFTYSKSLIRAEQVTNRCYAAVALPSPHGSDSTAMSPKKAKVADATLWQLRAYVTLPDGKITETILSIDTPLDAGAVEIIRVSLLADGSIIPLGNPHVGASVTLDWKDGSSQNVDI